MFDSHAVRARRGRRPTWSQMHPADDPEIAAERAAAFMCLSAAERLGHVRGLTVMARRLALTGLRRCHPTATEPELHQMLVRSIYGSAVDAYPSSHESSAGVKRNRT